VRHSGELVDGHVGLGTHVHARAALRVKVVKALKALFTTGAVRLEVAFAGLQEHAFGHNRGTDCLIASCCRAWTKGEEEEVDEGRGEHQEQSAPHVVVAQC